MGNKIEIDGFIWEQFDASATTYPHLVTEIADNLLIVYIGGFDNGKNEMVAYQIIFNSGMWYIKEELDIKQACQQAIIFCREYVAKLAKALQMESRNRSIIVSDQELTEAWGDANHSNVKREMLIALLEKIAQAKVDKVGKTYTDVLFRLGLIETRNGQIGLSNMGLCYLTNVNAITS